jgi:hypothetical protein
MDESFAPARRLTGTEMVRGVTPNRYEGSEEKTRESFTIAKHLPAQNFDLHGGQSAGRAAVDSK